MATSAAASSSITVPIDQISGFERSGSCLQSFPCQHSVSFVVNKRTRHHVHYVSGEEIARFLKVKKSRKGAHFNYIFENGRDGRMQERHMNKEPIQFGRVGQPGSFLLTYPEGYKPTKINPIKLPPKRPRTATKNDEPSEEGRAYLEKHGVLFFAPISLNGAKSMVKSLRSMYGN